MQLLWRKATYIYLILALIGLIAAGLDTIAYPGFVLTHFRLNPQLIIALCSLLAIATLVGLKNKSSKIIKQIAKINQYFFLPFFTAWTVGLTLLEKFTYPNFVYSHFHVNYDQFFYLMLISVITYVALLDRKFIKKYQNNLIVGYSFFLIFIGTLIYAWPMDGFKTLSSEDHIIEFLQFIFYFMSSLTAGFITWRTFKKAPLYITLYFAAFCLGLLFIAGEEISWGQRILNISTPEAYARINMQKETTVHNLDGLQQYQYVFYMIFSFFGFSSWILVKLLPKKIKKVVNKFVPSKYLAFYFIPIFVYYLNMNFLGGNQWEWQEYCEMILSIGLVFYIWKAKKHFMNKGGR